MEAVNRQNRVEKILQSARPDSRHLRQPKTSLANDAARLPRTIPRLVPGNFVGVHSAVNHRFNFFVRLPSRLQVHARRQLPVYLVAGLRNVPVVFFKREHSKRGELRHRKFFPREKNCLPRGAPADCKNYLGTGRAYFFCRGAVRHVRGLRLPADDLQPADNLLFLRDDLSVAGVELADKFVDSFLARHSTARRHAFAIRILGHANLLELEDDSRTISLLAEVESRVLSGRRLPTKFHLPRMVLGAFVFDGIFLGVDGGGHVVRRMVL